MTRRLVLGYLAITLIVLAMLEIPLAVFYSQREEERYIADAERDAVVLASFYEDVLHLGFEPDPAPATAYSERTTARIVVVDPDGISVLDTDAEPDRDFSTRPEIAVALTGIRSAGIRRSDTLDTDILFVAVPVASGGTVHGSLRLTIDAHEVTERIQRFWIGLIAIAAVVLASVAAVGWALARSVTKPLRQLEEAAHRFAKGDLKTQTLSENTPQEIAALGETMNTMASRLGQLIDTQRAFVSDASHQLRTPLTAMRLRLENLEAELATTTNQTEITRVIDEVERLSTLVNDLLHLAKAEQHPPTQIIDAAEIVADRADTWSAIAAEREISIELIADPGPSKVLAIPGALEQLLDNAIDNAVRAIPTGGNVKIQLTQSGSSTVITVSDDGPGLSDAHKQRALERFWRADPTSPGTGLGLAIAQSLTAACGGELRLADSPSGGLAVSFTLTAAPARETNKKTTKASTTRA